MIKQTLKSSCPNFNRRERMQTSSLMHQIFHKETNRNNMTMMTMTTWPRGTKERLPYMIKRTMKRSCDQIIMNLWGVLRRIRRMNKIRMELRRVVRMMTLIWQKLRSRSWNNWMIKLNHFWKSIQVTCLASQKYSRKWLYQLGRRKSLLQKKSQNNQ